MMKGKDMRKIYRIIAVLAIIWMAVGGATTAAAAANFSNETLHYVVYYKWGVIKKNAGEATLRIQNSGDKYKLQLTARTLPWADKIFMVRDTLVSTVGKNGFLPLSYSKITHEGDHYYRDDLTYSRSGNKTTATVKRKAQKKGEAMTTSKNSFTATGKAYDMLSVFYYLRTLNYSQLEKEGSTKVAIFSGSQVETLTIRYGERKMIKLQSGKKVAAIKITFSFTTDGRRQSSDNMEAWISADAAHTPLQVVGKLPIGAVKVDLV